MSSPLSGRARADVVVVPAPGHHLGEGVVVEGRVLAWLFGINLLRITADVVLVPAVMERAGGTDPGSTRPLVQRRRAGGTARRALPPSAGDGRPTLRDAVQLLRDTDALLERAGRV